MADTWFANYAAGIADLKFHDLRKTFGPMLAQNGISTAVTQKLLEHSSPHLTSKVYTNVDPVLRHTVEHCQLVNSYNSYSTSRSSKYFVP